MDGIPGLRPPAPTAPAARSKHTAAAAAPSAPDRDTFSPAAAEPGTAERTKPLTTDQILDLTSRYDLENMTQNQFGALLKELRDAGAITRRAFSDGCSGALLRESHPRPGGETSADFLRLLGSRSLSASKDGAGNPLAASYTELYKTINHLYTTRARFRTPEEVAADIVSQSSRTPQELGIPDLTGMNDREKLRTLAELHDATDYRGMSDVQRYKLIQDRFEAVFPNQLLYSTYDYGLRVNNDRPWDESLSPGTPKALRDYIRDEQERQWVGAGISAAPAYLHRMAYYGTGRSEETMRAIACLRHSGETAADRAALLEELRLMRLDGDAAGPALTLMRDGLGALDPDAPVSWQDMRELLASSLQAQPSDSGQTLQASFDWLTELLEEILS